MSIAETLSSVHQSQSRRRRFEDRAARLRAFRAVPSLATVQIEPFKANKREHTDSREPSAEQAGREEIEPFEYGADFGSSYFNYSRYCTRIYGQEQIQRNTDPEQRDHRETSNSRSSEQIRGQSEYQHMQEPFKQQPTIMRTDQQGRRRMAGWIHDSNGILDNDRTRSTIIANYRRTTDAIASATAVFRDYANENYPSIVSAVKGNQDRTEQLRARTKVIIGNTEAISRSTANYNAVHEADRGQDTENGTGYDRQRTSTRGNLNDTAFRLLASSQSSTELARNFRDIEANIVQIKERKKEMEKPQPKQDRGMNFGM